MTELLQWMLNVANIPSVSIQPEKQTALKYHQNAQ